jgi:beta-ribofuranosylaminobenzene 5'-phosphate synthase
MDLNGSLGRLYGTVGFTIDRSRLVVEVEGSDAIEANDPFAERFARRSRKALASRALGS